MTVDDEDEKTKLAAKMYHTPIDNIGKDYHQPAFTAFTSAQNSSIREKCGGGQQQ
jgi:hypothetical protein